MTLEQIFFLRVLSDHIHKKKTEPILNIDWNLITKWSTMHQVDGIIYYQCRDYMPADVCNVLHQFFLATLFTFTNREKVLQKIDNAFKEHGIAYLTVKGVDVARFYPVPFLRTMGDSDILIHKEDKEKAGSVLTDLGFCIGERNPDYDWTCVYNRMTFELHHNLLYEESVTIDKQAQFFNNYWKYENQGELDWSFHFLFLLAHLRKHIMHSGAGFRMFMDLAVIIENVDSLNWQWIEQRLYELDILPFSHVCFALVEQWFGIKAPIAYPQLDPSFIERATTKVFTNGIFGIHDKNTIQNGSINQLMRNGNTGISSRINILFRELFPNYNGMANSPYYHFVRGRKWLLPAAWTYRFIRLLRGRTASAKTIMSDIMISDDAIEARKNELREWGLWNH